ncbi:MAG: MoaD/ThiS family protein [Desulfobacterales bacterium]|nr:MoaD/ThiS family protein [Desulfobacterales bacterium]
MPENTTIELQLFASLKKYMPPVANSYAIEPGITVGRLIGQLDVPQDQIKLVFVNGVKAGLTTILSGGERVGIFPPVGGG